ncbi:MAG: class I SAM-dependent methyltransferase [Candidatus Bathyarchaeota archaeon]|nr:class I SAM-dependent methyltransferase [Candidatus Bathyarchaeota archaeon]
MEQELNLSSNTASLEPCLLDIGCGTGSLTEKIIEIYDLNTVGIDITNLFSAKDKAPYIVGSSCMLPFKGQSFRFCSAFSLIEHIPEDYRKQFFEEVKAILKKDGLFIIQLPNRYFPIEHHSFLPFVGYLPSRLHGLFYYDYVSVPSRNETIKELTKSGFIIVKNVNYGVPTSKASGHLLALRNVFFKILPFGFIIVAKVKHD